MVNGSTTRSSADRVGVLTITHTNNYGAELQAYALCRAIEKLGYVCELIDYECPHVAKVEQPTAPKLRDIRHPKGYLRSWLLLPERRRKQSAFSEFDGKYLSYGPKVAGERDISEYYRTVVVGSDQVWNGPVTGWDRTFLLDDPSCDGLRKLAYAASFGDSVIDEDERGLYRHALAKFEAVSAREGSGAEIAKELGASGARCVLDPTLLLEPAEWRAIAVPVPVGVPYVLAYFVNEHDNTLDFAKRAATELGARLIVVNRWSLRRDAGTMFFNTASPAEFLGLVANAEMVVTSSFHGTCLSILFERNFRYSLKIGVERDRSRMGELTGRLGLAETNVADRPDLSPIDYARVRETLCGLRAESVAFLESMLGGCGRPNADCSSDAGEERR